ncbi:ankyrin repeat-containing domain protein [Annulohypoxylon nitens]|nr:ankyrin repeat-containing domain protein [Annulohypoxylon nitens]
MSDTLPETSNSQLELPIRNKTSCLPSKSSSSPELPKLPPDFFRYIAKAETETGSMTDVARLSRTCRQNFDTLNGFMIRTNIEDIAVGTIWGEDDIPFDPVISDQSNFGARELEIIYRPRILAKDYRVSALIDAILIGNLKRAKAIIQMASRVWPDYLDAKDYYATTALGYAALEGYTEIVVELLNAGACIETPVPWPIIYLGTKYPKSRLFVDLLWTPLTQAMCEGHESLAMMIAQRSALTPEEEGLKPTLSPICMAALYGMPNLVKLLLSKGWSASQSVAKHNNTTPLHWAALRSDNREVIDILISHGADVHAESGDDWWRSPLLTAVYENEEENLACMISKEKEKGKWVEGEFSLKLEGDTFLTAVKEGVAQLKDGIEPDGIRRLLREMTYWYGFHGRTIKYLVYFAVSEFNEGCFDQGIECLYWMRYTEWRRGLSRHISDLIKEHKLDCNEDSTELLSNDPNDPDHHATERGLWKLNAVIHHNEFYRYRHDWDDLWS